MSLVEPGSNDDIDSDEAKDLEDREALEAIDALEGLGDDEFPDDAVEAPAPKASRRRPVWVMLLVIAVCIYLMISLRSDLFFYFVRSEPISLGDAIGFSGTDLPGDTYTSIYGIRNPSKGILLNALFGDKNVFQMMGTKLVFVETLAKNDKKSGTLSSEFYAGRMNHFADVSYFNTVRDFAAFQFGMDIPNEAILIKVYEKPGETHYVPLLFLLFFLIAAGNAWLLFRRLFGTQK